jgi:hypothetical protein
VSKEAEYRRHAATTLALAQRAKSNADRVRLLGMADAWLELADRAHKAARRHIERIGHLYPRLRSKILGSGTEAE